MAIFQHFDLNIIEEKKKCSFTIFQSDSTLEYFKLFTGFSKQYRSRLSFATNRMFDASIEMKYACWYRNF